MSSTAERFERLSDRFSDVINGVAASAWQSESPCDGWTAIDIVRHVVETERDFLARFDIVVSTGDDPVADWPNACAAMRAVLRDPQLAAHSYDGYFGPTTIAETIDTFYALDLLVHAWDLARATGQHDREALDVADIAHARSAMEPMGDIVRSPGIFGPAIDVPADASPQDSFLAWTGRQP